MATVPLKFPRSSCHSTPPSVLHSLWARPKALNCNAGCSRWVTLVKPLGLSFLIQKMGITTTPVQMWP